MSSELIRHLKQVIGKVGRGVKILRDWIRPRGILGFGEVIGRSGGLGGRDPLERVVSHCGWDALSGWFGYFGFCSWHVAGT